MSSISRAAQRQAIELNRFVHWGGKLVLLDEPFAALGVEQTRRGLEMIKRIAAQGIGVVIITHIIAQAFQVAERIVVIRQGRVAGNVARTATSPDEIIQMITGEGTARPRRREQGARAKQENGGSTMQRQSSIIVPQRSRAAMGTPALADRRARSTIWSRPCSTSLDRIGQGDRKVPEGRRLRAERSMPTTRPIFSRAR
jgi:ABC-type uncharacterized transport system ATPase subunit